MTTAGMGPEEILRDILERMSDDSPSDRGSQSVSWYAYRDAEKLNDRAFVPILSDLLRHEPSKDRRSDIYFILGCLGHVDAQLVEATLNGALDRETNRYLIEYILSALGKLPSIRDASRVRTLVSSTNIHVRTEAIMTLAKDDSGESEALLLELLESSQDKYDLVYAIATLGKVGTRATIPTIARFIHHPIEDVKCSAIHALAAIGSNKEQDVFLHAMTDRSSAAKAYAVAALNKHGDVRAVPAMAERARALLRRPRKIELIRSDLVGALEFLLRFEGAEEARSAINDAKRLYKGRVFPSEAQWIEQHLMSS